MNFLHHAFTGGPEKIVQVDLTGPANVLLMDRSNFDAYRRGSSFNYFGGEARRTRVRLRPPRLGNWHVVIDTGGSGRSVRASCTIF
jgi:hypothetical protein